MKKLMIGLMMGAMCLFVSAQEPTTKKDDTKEKTTTTKIGKRAKPSSMSTPGYTGIPKPGAPHRHSNPVPKRIPKEHRRPEGTNRTLVPIIK